MVRDLASPQESLHIAFFFVKVTKKSQFLGKAYVRNPLILMGLFFWLILAGGDAMQACAVDLKIISVGVPWQRASLLQQQTNRPQDSQSV